MESNKTGDAVTAEAPKEGPDLSALAKTCKEVSRSWPIQIAWLATEIQFRQEKHGPYLIVEMERTKLAHPTKMDRALRESGIGYVLMDGDGCYAPFTKAALACVDDYLAKNKPTVVWRSPAVKAAEKKLRAIESGKRYGT